jgi:succinyl-CoA synthetase beta subunit
LCSATGGIDVEEIVARAPGSLVRRTVDPTTGLHAFEAREIALDAGLDRTTAAAFATTLERLYRLFVQVDAVTVEINPLALVAGGTFVAASGVIVTDDQAAFRHPELAEIADPDLTNGWRPLTELERRMRALDRAHPDSPIRFNEWAGFFALDTILDLGGAPATTFDITPGQFEEKLRAAVGAVAARPGLRGFFAGGNVSNFMPIDMRVRAIVDGLRDAGVDPRRMPVVFRFDGPCIDAAKRIAGTLPGIEFYDAATTLDDAVARIVTLTAP